MEHWMSSVVAGKEVPGKTGLPPALVQPAVNSLASSIRSPALATSTLSASVFGMRQS